jgi:hypothetical protein
MKKKSTPGLFDEDIRLQKISEQGDPLIKLKSIIRWEIFRKDIEKVFDKEPNGMYLRVLGCNDKSHEPHL